MFSDCRGIKIEGAPQREALLQNGRAFSMCYPLRSPAYSMKQQVDFNLVTNTYLQLNTRANTSWRTTSNLALRFAVSSTLASVEFRGASSHYLTLSQAMPSNQPNQSYCPTYDLECLYSYRAYTHQGSSSYFSAYGERHLLANS